LIDRLIKQEEISTKSPTIQFPPESLKSRTSHGPIAPSNASGHGDPTNRAPIIKAGRQQQSQETLPKRKKKLGIKILAREEEALNSPDHISEGFGNVADKQ
jgi:hypothetical protein